MVYGRQKSVLAQLFQRHQLKRKIMLKLFSSKRTEKLLKRERAHVPQINRVLQVTHREKNGLKKKKKRHLGNAVLVSTAPAHCC